LAGGPVSAVKLARFAGFGAAALAALTLPAAADNLTYHGDTLRSGWTSNETTLTPANVGSSNFGRNFTVQLDAVTFGQPLVADGEATQSGTHDLVVVATTKDTVYAIDADSGQTVWKTSLLPAGAKQVTAKFTNCGIAPTYGIVSTPVIDRTRDTVYVVGVSLERHKMVYRLHALSLASGADLQTPVEIQGSVKAKHGIEEFDPNVHTQRPALTEANGNIYVGFGSICDYHPKRYHGWIFSFNAQSLVQNAIYNSTPARGEGDTFYGGIWMGGNGPAADTDGSLFFAVGNGTFDNQTSFGDSVVHLSPALAQLDYFTPYTVSQDNAYDADLGSGGTMLLPNPHGSPLQVAVAQGKDVILTLMNRAHLGGYTPSGPDNVLAELSLGGVWSSPAYWEDSKGNEYVFTTGGPLYAVAVTRNPASLAVVGQTNEQYPEDNGNGSTPTISSNGTQAGTAVAWIVQYNGGLTLYAYDPTNLGTPLFNASLGGWDLANTYVVPTVDNGRVFAMGEGVLYQFGLSGGARAKHPHQR
jgi:hypothetical protein